MGGVASVEEGEGIKLHLPAASIHRGSVYKMSQPARKGKLTDLLQSDIYLHEVYANNTSPALVTLMIKFLSCFSSQFLNVCVCGVQSI